MADKILVIISTAEREKALTGLMYAVNALKHGWMKEVQLFFFGPAEKLLLRDNHLQALVQEFQSLQGKPIACKFIAEREEIGDQIAELGVEVVYVGERISDLVKSGFVPMVW